MAHIERPGALKACPWPPCPPKARVAHTQSRGVCLAAWKAVGSAQAAGHRPIALRIEAFPVGRYRRPALVTPWKHGQGWWLKWPSRSDVCLPRSVTAVLATKTNTRRNSERIRPREGHKGHWGPTRAMGAAAACRGTKVGA